MAQFSINLRHCILCPLPSSIPECVPTCLAMLSLLNLVKRRIKANMLRINLIQIPPGPITIPERNQRPKLDKAMYIPKRNLTNNEWKIRRILKKVRDDLDHLCPEHKDQEDYQFSAAGLFSEDKGRDEQRIPYYSKVDKAGPVHIEATPCVPRDKSRITKHDWIAAKSRACPAK
ncbi:hypothetical protein FOTG_11871 [Fusarium oxysporum f. sp. vasinfectum 25433]|uniref:Uncharacterized protein n=1 Tax=Fusarium oxysporum f. sp. vasinfectum 25433 TaxID=1089449 RepID=X0MIB1_FUSOX|nr:hypothetical protein FOTG_11871 [Fusarium oxysporum f. sp. vasinfectum 25433]EXM20285.1 hypothetical protein FOTG_11871 [Fusarium oxysporum f. sp. vasinfectum 25433]EXM20286.1 hypothetical protein FOTG_11871 [Fusarium oxysporum f. sp. vasinfectum 25433]